MHSIIFIIFLSLKVYTTRVFKLYLWSNFLFLIFFRHKFPHLQFLTCHAKEYFYDYSGYVE